MKTIKIFCLILTCLLLLPLGCALSIPDQDILVFRNVGKPVFLAQANCSADAFPPDTSGYSAPHELSGERISILNWNIYKNKTQQWQEDFLKLSKGQDIILLQEVLLSDKMSSLLREQQLYWRLNRAFSYNNQAAGVLIGSAAQPVSTCGLRHKEPLLRVPKTILLNRYSIKGSARDLLVANIHGVNFTLGSAPYREQMAELRTILEQHDGPLLVAGDFNNWSEAKSKVLEEMAEALLLQQLVFDTPEQTRIMGRTVDHVFYRGLEVLVHAAHPVESSDHNALSAVFRVNGAAQSDKVL